MSLYRYIRHCLITEQSLIEQSEKLILQQQQQLQPTQLSPTAPVPATATPNTASTTTPTGLSASQYGTMSYETDPTGEIMEKLSMIKHKTMETGDILRRMEQEQEAFALKCHDRQKLEGIIHLHRMQQTQPTAQSQALEKNFQEQKQRLEYELKQRVSNF